MNEKSKSPIAIMAIVFTPGKVSTVILFNCLKATGTILMGIPKNHSPKRLRNFIHCMLYFFFSILCSHRFILCKKEQVKTCSHTNTSAGVYGCNHLHLWHKYLLCIGREICWKSTRGTKALKTHFFLRMTGIPEQILSGRVGKRSWK